ncbi:unnamed protein product [Linum trigynum]|uniref:DYW domain-containing protein n=1 Tax=Linum trigynum TaxID=586398 RepID=A0AAV2CJI6_9ROSI
MTIIPVIRSPLPLSKLGAFFSIGPSFLHSLAAATHPLPPPPSPPRPPSCDIIQDHDLLCKSQHASGTGLHVLDLIDGGALEPDRSLYHALLKKCTRLGKLAEGRIVHTHFLNSRFSRDSVLLTTLINLYAKCGSLDDARQVFDRMPNRRDIVAWTALIAGFSQRDQPRDALLLYRQMVGLGILPNEFTLASVLKAASGLGPAADAIIHGMQLHSTALKFGYVSDVFVGSALLDMYARCEHMDEAQVIFYHLRSRNEVSWNALIAAHARKGEAEHAFLLFSNMLRENVQPTQFTYSSVLNACAVVGSLEQGKWVHAVLVKSKADLVGFVGNTLLDMYAKSGSIEEAKKVFDRLTKRDIVSWNTLLKGYAQHGSGDIALQTFDKMLRIGIPPNDITFLCVLTACSHAGLVGEGLNIFNQMKKYKIEPQVSHYVTIVDLLGRAGQLDRAKKFIEEMPIEPTAAVWGALLGACRMHKKPELGAYAAERIFELDPRDPGPHMLLYNIYASAGRWVEATKVRKMMKESGVKKEPACSWVEIENEVHVFVADDDSHPDLEEIHAMWENVRCKIKQIGYKPDANHVLLCLDQREREVKLQQHSEKLALAFALLNTPPGSTIRIKKNIRVCGDCHSAFKFVSKALNRVIVVRDTNRFHHFREGFCSCRDYW